MDNEFVYEDAPPDYDSIDAHATSRKTIAFTQLCWTNNIDYDPPPSTRWFVRSKTDPPAWKLLAAPLMSSATAHSNSDPYHKRRYRVLYPANYEDVYLHKTPWIKHADALPTFHVELYGRERYEAEPIVVLGPCIDSNDSSSDSIRIEAKALAASHLPGVISSMRQQVTRTARFVKFVESEYWSWDWKCKTDAATNDMRALILQAKQACSKSAMLINKTEDFLDHLRLEEASSQRKAVTALSKRVEELKRKLRRLRL